MQLHTSDPNLSTLINRIDKGRIDLQPDFQRGEVWSVKKRQRLIDTLLRDWHVPPIHLVKKDSTHDELLEVLDGQQRLSAIWGFIHNEFPIDGSSPPSDKRIEENSGKYWSELDDRLKDSLLDRTIRVLTISQCQPSEAAELFYRLNQPTSLTASEQRNAYFGHARDQVRNIVRNMKSQGVEATLVGFSNARMAYDDVVAKTLTTLDLNSFDKKLTAGLIADKYRSGEKFTMQSEQLTLDGLAMFLSAAREKSGTQRFNKASAYTWIVFFSKVSHFIAPEARKKFINFVPKFYEYGITRSNATALETFMVEAFMDRATSRVSDISSVKIRDFCIHAVLCKQNEVTADEATLLGLDKILQIREELEYALNQDGTLPILQIVEYLKWGRRLIDDSDS